MARRPSRTTPSPSPVHDDTRRSSPNVPESPSEAQIEQDLGFFAGPSSPAAVSPANPAARHFFGRQRRLSETSTNSDAAFIDHRSQQAIGAASRHRSTTLSKTPSRALHRTLARGNSDGSEQRASHDGASPSLRRNLIDISPPASPALRARDPEDAEEAVMDHRPSLHRGTSQRSRRSHEERRAEEGSLDGRSSGRRTPPIFTPAISRQPSHERAEADVCFPHLELREENRVAESRAGPPLHHGLKPGLPGVLPNYPFPFDFGALEDYADSERIMSSPPDRHEPLISFGSPESAATRLNGYGMHSDAKSTTRRHRKLSESAGTGRNGRYQRKLALFEGFGAEGAAGGATDTAAVQHLQRAAADNRVAALGRTRPGPQDRQSSGPNRAVETQQGGVNEKERPYRFSFYSNALPSTIHARSLAELPADGQSFEELFVGSKRQAEAPAQWDETASDADAMGASTPSTAIHGSTAQGQKSALTSRAMMRSDEDTEDNTWWLDVLCPTDAEMRIFSKAFGIHPLTTEDIQMEETREKIELFRNYYLVCFRSFDQDPYSPTYLEPLNMYVIVFREGTLSFHYRATAHPQNVRRRIKQLKDYISVSSDWISYALIDDITDAFGPLIQNIEYEVDSIDELVLILKETEQSDMLRRIGTCRKKVMGLLRLMGNKADVVKGLAKRCNENWSVAPKSDIGLYLSDIQDHLLTMTSNLNHYEKILSRSHSNYLAQISIEMTEANNQINDVLSKLTCLGTVLLPANLVTGLFGMNVLVPGQEVESLTWFFSITGTLLALMVCAGSAIWIVMRRR